MMTSIELVTVILAAISLLSGFIFIGINIYFIVINKKYLKKMDDYVCGKDNVRPFDNLLFRWFRLVDYIMLITFPWVAQRNHPNAKQLSREAPISRTIRYLMNTSAICLLLCSFSMIVGYLLMPS